MSRYMPFVALVTLLCITALLVATSFAVDLTIELRPWW